MTEHEAPKVRARYLDPIERSLEVLFGLIMVLTFTQSMSVLGAGREEVREMLIGALGCNLAWGIIDACFYVMGALSERGRGSQLLRRLRETTDDAAVSALMREAMPDVVVDAMSPDDRARLRGKLVGPAAPRRATGMTGSDLAGALGVFLLVFTSTLPVALPFLFVSDPRRALRLSNVVAVTLLFTIGYRLGAHSGTGPWRVGLFMVLLGSLLVALTIALGG
jgi:VIT1/CCC1 family predicted Fe2+/Mn2+ transporter